MTSLESERRREFIQNEGDAFEDYVNSNLINERYWNTIKRTPKSWTYNYGLKKFSKYDGVVDLCAQNNESGIWCEFQLKASNIRNYQKYGYFLLDFNQYLNYYVYDKHERYVRTKYFLLIGILNYNDTIKKIERIYSLNLIPFQVIFNKVDPVGYFDQLKKYYARKFGRSITQTELETRFFSGQTGGSYTGKLDESFLRKWVIPIPRTVVEPYRINKAEIPWATIQNCEIIDTQQQKLVV